MSRWGADGVPRTVKTIQDFGMGSTLPKGSRCLFIEALGPVDHGRSVCYKPKFVNGDVSGPSGSDAQLLQSATQLQVESTEGQVLAIQVYNSRGYGANAHGQSEVGKEEREVADAWACRGSVALGRCEEI